MLAGYNDGGATNYLGRAYLGESVTVECWHEATATMVTKTYLLLRLKSMLKAIIYCRFRSWQMIWGMAAKYTI